MAPYLDVSLKASGKSRADLWAFAAIAAVEHGIETNNEVCDETYNGNPGIQCNAFIGTEKCHVRYVNFIRNIITYDPYLMVLRFIQQETSSSKQEGEIVLILEMKCTRP